MFRKLFSCLLPQSKHAPSSSSLRSPATPPQGPRTSRRERRRVHTWAASLPNDFFLDVLLRLEPAAVVCCAGVCKPWRRAIVHNVSTLGPHLDRFFRPSLLLGIYHYYIPEEEEEALIEEAWLQRTPGPFQSALPAAFPPNGSGGGGSSMATLTNSFPTAGALPILLSSRDGFMLVLPAKTRIDNFLSLCNPMTGYCAMIPAATGSRHNNYILLTASGEPPAVRILAVHRRDHSSIISLDEEALAYQIFSTSRQGDDRAAAWVWGPVVRSSSSSGDGGELVPPAGLWVRTDHRRTVVCGDAVVYWLAGPAGKTDVTCVFALDVRTGRTWTTELPPAIHHQCHPDPEAFSSILATSGDGRRLSLIRSLGGPKIQVWVLLSQEWTLHRTIAIDVVSLRSPTAAAGGMTARSICLSSFCPRSRCVVAIWSDQVLLIDVDGSGGVVRRIGQRKKGHHLCYIAKMKHLLG